MKLQDRALTHADGVIVIYISRNDQLGSETQGFSIIAGAHLGICYNLKLCSLHLLYMRNQTELLRP